MIVILTYTCSFKYIWPLLVGLCLHDISDEFNELFSVLDSAGVILESVVSGKMFSLDSVTEICELSVIATAYSQPSILGFKRLYKK